MRVGVDALSWWVCDDRCSCERGGVEERRLQRLVSGRTRGVYWLTYDHHHLRVDMCRLSRYAAHRIQSKLRTYAS
jgi:hypothetical protein